MHWHIMTLNLSRADLRYFVGYHWPGNELELQGLVQRAVLLHPPAPVNNSSGSCCGGSSSSSCNGSGSSSSYVEGCGVAVLALDAADFWPAAEEADR
jgi:transcriptional regulator with GAF, ATPase, and Fis domain